MTLDELPEFPAFMRPLMNYSYSHNGANINRSDVAGGSSRQTLSYFTNKVVFNVSFIMTSFMQVQIFNDFYFNVILQGTRKFSMLLNATGPFEKYACLIVPGSLSVSGNAPFRITMQIEVEKINAPFEGQLYWLNAEGYGNLPAYFSRIQEFANIDLV